MEKIVYRPIGIIHTPFKEVKDAPRQATLAQDVEAVVELFPELQEGLSNLEGFSHIIILFHLHLSEGFSLKVTPSADTRLRGLFATRSPRRPNPIGLSVVRLVKIEENRLHIRGADMVDKTPVLDIKPYIPKTDSREDVRMGWLEDKIGGLGDTGGASRPSPRWRRSASAARCRGGSWTSSRKQV